MHSLKLGMPLAKEWQLVYNHERPYEALGSVTTAENALEQNPPFTHFLNF